MRLNWQNRLKFNQMKPGDAVSGVFRFSKADTYELFIRGNYRQILLKNSLIWMGDFPYENQTTLYLTYK